MEATMTVNSLQAKKRDRRALLAWQSFIFLFVLLAEIAGAYIVIYKGGAMMGDALSRTANAYYVLFLQPHKLASIGFVWNPLPSLVQLLILPFTRFWQPLASIGFAGFIATALFAGANSALLFRYFRQAGLNTGLSLLIVALYTFNPFVFYYGFNGMSEIFLFTCIIVCTANFSMWTQDRKTGRIVVVGLMLAVAFLTRYETFALMLGLGFAMLIAIYMMNDNKSPFNPKPMRMKWDYSVATGTVIFLPVLYTILMWMFLNWTIMGDPLFFLNSAYSNESQSALLLYGGFKDSVRDPFSALSHAWTCMRPFMPLFFVITGERIYTKRLIRSDYLVLVALIGAITGFHWVMLMLGKSFGWLRFFSFSLVYSIAWLPYELTQLKKGAVRTATIIFACLALIFSGWMLLQYFEKPDVAKEEYQALSGNDMNRTEEQRLLAEMINEKYSESTILMDAFMTPGIILNVKHPENLLTNIADDLFDLAVLDPQAQGIDYLVVPSNYVDEYDHASGYGGAGNLDAINNEHRRLYGYGAEWADLVYHIDGYKMYKVIRWDLPTADLLAHVDAEYADATLLFDNSTTGILHKTMKNPKNAITLMSDDFEAALANPQQYGVEYIIVPRTAVDESGSTDAVIRAYPELLNDGYDWAELVYGNLQYRVFKVLYPEGWDAQLTETASSAVSEAIGASASPLPTAGDTATATIAPTVKPVAVVAPTKTQLPTAEPTVIASVSPSPAATAKWRRLQRR